MAKKPKDRYVIGYPSAGNVVYGGRHFILAGPKQRVDDYCHPMTLNSARGKLKQMCDGAAIFKLVRVKG